MSNYQRATRRCSFQQLNSEFKQVFLECLHAHETNEVDLADLICCETISTKKASGSLPAWLTGEIETVFSTIILLSANTLLWIRVGEIQKETPHINCASLNDIRVKWFSSIFTKDCGLQITGIMDGSKSIVHGKIFMENIPEAQQFCEDVRQAIEKINPTPEQKYPTWMGGR